MSAAASAEVVGILLAAGLGTRFGGDKLMHPMSDGVPLGSIAARHLRTVCGRCIAVLRPEQQILADQLRAEGFEVYGHADACHGMGRSLALGVRQAPDAAGWLVALADMPFICRETYASLARSVAAGSRLVAPYTHGRRGHPVGFGKEWYQELIALTGDTGARSILAKYGEKLTRLDVDDGGVLLDVDTPADLAGIN